MVESEPAKVTCSAAVPPTHAERLHSRHEQRGSHLCCQLGSNVAVPQLLSFRVFNSSADRCTVVLSFRQSHARAHSTTPTSAPSSTPTSAPSAAPARFQRCSVPAALRPGLRQQQSLSSFFFKYFHLCISKCYNAPFFI